MIYTLSTGWQHNSSLRSLWRTAYSYARSQGLTRFEAVILGLLATK